MCVGSYFGMGGLAVVEYYWYLVPVSIVVSGFPFAAQSLWCPLRGWCVLGSLCVDMLHSVRVKKKKRTKNYVR